MPRPPNIVIIIYTMYGHIATMAEAVKAGVESAGGQAEIFQVPETLSEEFLASRHAPPKPSYKIITPEDLKRYDGFLLGIPARYGNMPAQWKTFLDATGWLWAQGDLHGKCAGVFVSTGFLGGGQESTVFQIISTLAHHGMCYVPLGYKTTLPLLSRLDEAHGGSPWGAGTCAGADGSRKPTELERDIAKAQGHDFYKFLARIDFDIKLTD